MRSLAPLSALGSTQLTELYAACNKVTAIESLGALTQLRVLELGGNRIRVLEGGPGGRMVRARQTSACCGWGKRAAGQPPPPSPPHVPLHQ